MFRRLILFVAVLSLMTACQDKREDISVPPLSLSETEVTVGPLGRYYTVNIGNVSPDDSVVAASTSSDWVQVDELSSSMIRIYVCPNDDESRRTATVCITTNYGGSATLSVIQRSDAESDANALPTGDNLTVQGRVGFGYDLMCDYMDPKSATELIFDYNALLLAEREYGTIVAQDRRNRLDYTLHTAYSIAEMAENLMSEQTDGVKFFGLSRKMTKYKSVKSFRNEAQSYGFAKISKIVATRYIDMGKIDALIQENRTEIFTDEFRKYYEAVLNDPSESTIETMVKKYGTHVVTYADLGGRLEYTINFQANQVSRDEMEATMKYKNGNLKDSDTKRRKEQMSNISSSMDVIVYGGSKNTRDALQKASPTNNTNQQIPCDLLAAWTNTIVNDSEHQDNLTMANCRLTPIWQLFPQENIRNMILSYILRMSENLVLSPQMREQLGLSGYKRFKVNKLGIDDFGTDEKASLVKVVYEDRVPLLEICNEYVPEIRGDKRVTIIYPIMNQRSNIRRGIFPGNGENAPCEVSFDDEGGCYVAQIEGYKTNDRIDSLFYIDGALYDKNMNVPTTIVSNTDIREQRLAWSDVFEHSTYEHFEVHVDVPIVKIGSGYWSRTYFKSFVGIRYFKPGDGISFGRSWMRPPNFSWGREKQDWFYPDKKDLKALTNYIGNHIKVLFKGQQSGLSPDFIGYRIVQWDDWHYPYAHYDYNIDMNGNDCAIAFINDRQSDEAKGVIMLLQPDYSISFYEGVFEWVHTRNHDSFVKRRVEAPVFAFHNSNFIYPYL
ncbi:MAG: hypothetical protein J5705_07640 [Bacteroidaceae bacterium]|nr:hypothetical protein [Bacteroidaceae bacterium]